MKLLIEIWGNYQAWRRVTYSYNNNSIDSSTTLPLLYTEIKPDKSIIIVADTLIENEIAANPTQYHQDISYSELCKKVHDSTFEFIKTATQNFCPASMYHSVSVLVAPAVGTFRHTQFIGNPNNFFSYIYFFLAKTVIAIAQTNNDDTIEIYVDITHGINYMTMITYRTIKDICTILAHFFNITFVVLNSDPFVGAENINLTINQIEKVKVMPQLVIYKHRDTLPLRISHNLDNCLKADINKMLQDNMKHTIPNFRNLLENTIYPFAGAACNAAPIFMIYFFPDLNILHTTVENIVELFFKYFNIRTTNKLCIQQQVDFTSTFITLLQNWLFAQLLATKYSIAQYNEIKLSLIYSLMNVLKDNQIATSRIYREVEKIKAFDNKMSIPHIYNDYGKINMGENYQPDTNVDTRNFFAHAGFGYTFTQLKKEQNTIYIKPKDQAVDSIKNTLSNSLPQGVV
ncbi:MAG: CRISPR-associated CARF protein Csx1 [Spirochaetes bacterium]|nr:CRISPR-associated CARF protein Csx1 [Spirochaetota bacterium]